VRTLCDVPGAFRPPGSRSADTWVFPVMVRGALGAVIAVSRKSDQVAAHNYLIVGQLATQLGVGLTNARLLEEIDRANWEMVEALSRAIDAKSPWTAGHSTRVTMVGLALGRRLGFDDRQLESVHRGGLLHDIGKLGIPVEILDKPGQLSVEEMDVMKQHPAIGARIVQPISAYADVVAAVRHHHERYDGTGYPDRLAGEAIPMIARIFAVADVFDSLASPRPYREAWDHRRVLDYIVEGAGTQFDPRVVEAFLAEIHQFLPSPTERIVQREPVGAVDRV
jgi:putative nucleotidyltransferase with HDIG domain